MNRMFMPPKPEAGYQPLQGYRSYSVQLPATGVSSGQIPVEGFFLGIRTVTPFVMSGAQGSDAIFVCLNSSTFNPSEAIPLKPGSSVTAHFTSLVFALRSEANPDAAPIDNTSTVTVRFDVSKGVIVAHQGPSTLETFGVQGSGGNWFTPQGNSRSIFVAGSPTQVLAQKNTFGVTAVAQQVFAGDLATRGWLISNNTGSGGVAAADMWWGFDNTLVAGNAVAAGGGNYIGPGGILGMNDLDGWKGDIWIISNVAGPNPLGVKRW